MSSDDLNRQQRRMLKRQGMLDERGNPKRDRQQREAPRDRVGPIQYLREVREEIRKVAWPTKQEVVRYSIVVGVTVAVMALYVGGLDLGLSELAKWFYS